MVRGGGRRDDKTAEDELKKRSELSNLMTKKGGKENFVTGKGRLEEGFTTGKGGEDKFVLLKGKRGEKGGTGKNMKEEDGKKEEIGGEGKEKEKERKQIGNSSSGIQGRAGCGAVRGKKKGMRG